MGLNIFSLLPRKSTVEVVLVPFVNFLCYFKMTASTSASWTIVHQEDTSDHSSDIQSLRNALEKGNEYIKIQTMQKMLVIMLNGDPLPGLLMHVIRFVLIRLKLGAVY